MRHAFFLDMHSAVKFLFLVIVSWNDLTSGIVISYEELKKLNATCDPEDTCQHLQRHDDSPGVSRFQKCSCNRLCSQFDTCCIDSFYNSVKSSNLRPACRKIRSSYIDAAYFMVDRCSHDGRTDSAFSKLCDTVWDGEDDDIMKLVPVTSLLTSMTYKNYFCFRCHESTGDYLYWNVWLKSNDTCNVQTEMKHEALSYSKEKKSWVVQIEKSDIWISVDLKFDVPQEIWSLPVECEPDLISDCNLNWTDSSTREKCLAYMAVVFFKRDWEVLTYRNPHCALCNFESLDGMICKRTGPMLRAKGSANDFGEPEKAPFSFTHLLDINRRDGNTVGKIQRCRTDHVWDPFAKRCRAVTCALPGFVRKGKTCVRQWMRIYAKRKRIENRKNWNQCELGFKFHFKPK